ncbi:MAG TPA: ABC transporter permease, partial [Chitinophagaceae bacterium]|nr:ABC transporter permease [Chitinophagaceae bacterium]
MKVAAFIANRIAFNPTAGSGGKRSFSRFIIRLSTVATMISVMVMIVTLSLANGFQEKVSQKVFSFLGHIRIQEKQPDKAIISEETPIIKDDPLVDMIRRNPEVDGIYPYATKYGILKTKDEIEGVLIKGFDSTYDFNRLKEFIKEGRPVRFTEESYSREIMISKYTTAQLKLKLNDSILIYFIRSGSPEGEENNGLPDIRARKLTVVGIFQTGIEDYDKIF